VPKRFVARQPIFDQHRRVYGYELLFRSGLANFFSHPDGDLASDAVIDGFFLLGMEALTGGRRAFINCTRDVLLKGYASLLPKQRVALEILEDVTPDEDVINACRALKAAGYVIALDDFDDREALRPLVELADIIKVDFLVIRGAQRKALVERFSPVGVRLLAEKVETHDDFKQAAEMGYAHIQGNFFARPEIVSGQDIPGFKLNYLRILQAILEPELDLAQMESIIKQDASLCFRLLRYLNSILFGFREEIRSIRHALGLLGDEQVRKWASMVIATGMAQDKPSELVVSCLVRAKFCELLSEPIGLLSRSTDLFLMGMLSLMDAILDRPLASILDSIPVSPDIKAGLLGEQGVFHHTHRLVLACEGADWEALVDIAAKLRLSEENVSESYFKSLEWSRQVFQSGSS
jgi:c-di-GMP-related signal transduction protein